MVCLRRGDERDGANVAIRLIHVLLHQLLAGERGAIGKLTVIDAIVHDVVCALHLAKPAHAIGYTWRSEAGLKQRKARTARTKEIKCGGACSGMRRRDG